MRWLHTADGRSSDQDAAADGRADRHTASDVNLGSDGTPQCGGLDHLAGNQHCYGFSNSDCRGNDPDDGCLAN